jgi:NADPH:quinone reductase-like Zn-dependent oxidoreductase
MLDHGDAIVMRQYGRPDVLRVEKVLLTPVQPGEARIRVLASTVNHSDLEIRAGNWPIPEARTFPLYARAGGCWSGGRDWCERD